MRESVAIEYPVAEANRASVTRLMRRTLRMISAWSPDATACFAVLVGADGFRAESVIAKAQRDLTALLYADGIHDSLYLFAGDRLVAAGHDPVVEPTATPPAPLSA
ncbi:hypothetical protein [Saccharothrix sp. Mg75]|uniref:hypothetical protein n=1 Tax=Saccharothrix sp. Mg75 TaxID=3445357 RepID=UPI003EEAE3DF